MTGIFLLSFSALKTFSEAKTSGVLHSYVLRVVQTVFLFRRQVTSKDKLDNFLNAITFLMIRYARFQNRTSLKEPLHKNMRRTSFGNFTGI